MEDFAENLGWKKIAAILIVFGVLFLGFVILSSFGSRVKTNKQTTQPTTQETALPTAVPSSPPIQTNPAPSSIPPIYRYTDLYFQVDYPSSLKAVAGPKTGAVTSLFLSVPQNDEKIIIQSYDNAGTSVDRISKIFTAYGYGQKAKILGNLNAVEFAGGKKIGSLELQEIAIVAGQGARVYKLQLSYNSAVRIEEIESQFYQIASTFKPI